MKLKAGMYVRTDKGRIGKVLTDPYEFKDDYNEDIEFNDGVEDSYYMFDDIIKASHNIIDLIEEGDYVNGGQVREKTKKYIRISGGKSLWEYLEKEEDIKSIVTKEQFESMSYKL